MSDRSADAGVVVTGDGNTVTLTFGRSGVSLPLIRKQFRPVERRRRPAPGEPPRELDLLDPETGRLPLIGRRDVLAELQTWLDDEVDISVHALIGPAGSGKTRLAMELCQRIDRDPGGNDTWIAGFLSADDLRAVVDIFASNSFEWAQPTLLVIDNAAQCQQGLALWLDRLSSQKLDAKLRLLLLDREAPESFGWWYELTSPGSPARRDLFYALRPRRLPDLAELEERRALMAASLQAARELRPGASIGTHIPVKGEDPDFDRRLAEPQFGNPSALVMAGVIALDRDARSAMALRHLEVARRLGRRELDRMVALAQSRGVSGDAMRHTVAFNGLMDGIPVIRLRQIVADELAASHRSADLGSLLNLLEQELPPRTEAGGAGGQPRLTTIQPDLIGEAVIIEAFTGRASTEAEAAEAVRRAYGLSLDDAARAVVRLIQDFGYPLEDESATGEEKATARRVMDWFQSLVRELKDPEEILPLVLALPEQTMVLREPAAELTQRLVTYFRQQAEHTNQSLAWTRVAALLNNLANRLGALGRRDQALAAAEEAVSLHRALAAAHPNAFTPDLAGSLNNFATMLSTLGRREESLAAAEEAVRLYRALAAARADAFTPDLALSLNTLASALSALGRREEALTAAEEAVHLYRSLAAARPGAFAADLATSLNKRAATLSALGQREEALATAEEAVHLNRTLAAMRPDAFTPDLALSLNTLASALSALGRREEALTVAIEPVRLYRNLATVRPDAFTPDLAKSLNTLANTLSDLGRREEALAAAEEAVRLYRALASGHPGAFSPDLAFSLNNLSNRLSAVGRREEAATLADEAVRLYRALTAERPEALTPDLAGSLNNLANRLSALGRREEALAAVDEAVRLYRSLAAEYPGAFTSDLAGSLNNLAVRLSDLGRHEGALAVAEEAVRLRRTLAAARPDAFSPDLAMSLNNLASMLSAMGRREEALAAAEEAVRLYRTPAAARPDTYTPDLALSLNNLANRLNALGRREEALAAAGEAVRRYRALAAARPDAFTPALALSLNNFATMLSTLGRREESLAAAEEAVRLYRALAAERPDTFGVELARSLWVLGDLYGETGEADRGSAAISEAIQLLTPILRMAPGPVGGVMAGLLQSYRMRCEALGRQPDTELIGPAISVLRQLELKEEAG